MDSYTTDVLYNSVIQQDNIEDFKKNVLAKIGIPKNDWINKINTIITDNQYSNAEFGKLCGVSPTMVRKWRNEGAIPSRKKLIRIGFAAHYDIEELNHLLQRYGRYSALYAKDLEDSIYLYVLSSPLISHTYEECQRVITKVENKLQKTEFNNYRYSTEMSLNYVMNLKTEEELDVFIENSIQTYRKRFEKLYTFIEVYIAINNTELSVDGYTNISYSVNMLAESQNWSSSLRTSVSEISQRKWLPLRDKIISLGLHLNMDINQINQMLGFAQMEKLCAKNPIEAAIIFAVEDASLNNLIFQDGSNDLCLYVKEILKQLDLDGGFIDELA